MRNVRLEYSDVFHAGHGRLVDVLAGKDASVEPVVEPRPHGERVGTHVDVKQRTERCRLQAEE